MDADRLRGNVSVVARIPELEMVGVCSDRLHDGALSPNASIRLYAACGVCGDCDSSILLFVPYSTAKTRKLLRCSLLLSVLFDPHSHPPPNDDHLNDLFRRVFIGDDRP